MKLSKYLGCQGVNVQKLRNADVACYLILTINFFFFFEKLKSKKDYKLKEHFINY